MWVLVLEPVINNLRLDETYEELRKDLPKIGKTVETKQGKGKVVSLDVLKRTYNVEVENIGIVKVDINESSK